MVRQDVTHVFACSFKPLASDAVKLSPAADTYVVSVPCIVNTKKIAMGQEVILKGQPTSNYEEAAEEHSTSGKRIRPDHQARNKEKESDPRWWRVTHGGGAA